MGKIKKILENELIGGTQSTDVYPVTSVKAVYDESNERLDDIIKRKGVVNISTNYNTAHTAEVLTLAQAIAKVPTSDRVLGFSGTFLSSSGWESYQFTGSSVSEWSDQTKWKSTIKVLQELGNSTQFPVSQKAVSDEIKKSQCFFQYSPQYTPNIEKTGIGSNTVYTVTIKSGTYYIVSSLGNKNLTISSDEIFTIRVGGMLIADYDKGTLELIPQVNSSKPTHYALLLSNMGDAIGQFSSIIVKALQSNEIDILSNTDFKHNYVKTFGNFDSDINEELYKTVAPILKCDFFVPELSKDDVFGIGTLENNERADNKAHFYIYDVTKQYNIVVFDWEIESGSKLTGVKRFKGNATYKDRIEVWIDLVIDWDLYNKSIRTTNPTIFLKSIGTIGDSLFNYTFPTNSSSNRISSSAEEYFTVEVNGVKPNSELGFDAIQSDSIPSNTQYHDMCHYKQLASEKPIKLLILCHGGGKTITENEDLWFTYENIGNIFVSLGYAVLLTNGMPEDWADEKGIPNSRPLGNWMAIQSIVKAYQYVANKYNIDTNGCYIYGQSQGGMTAENIAELSGLPILATVLESPAISMRYAQLFINGTASALQALYGFNSIETYNKNLCQGLDPFVRNVDIPITLTGSSVETLDIDIENMENKKFRKNTPVLIIRSLTDTVISPKVIGAYAKAIINAGGNCKLITYQNAGHSTITTTDIVGSINGFNVRAALYEICVFLQANGGYNTTIQLK